jgi:hypothetical protein
VDNEPGRRFRLYYIFRLLLLPSSHPDRAVEPIGAVRFGAPPEVALHQPLADQIPRRKLSLKFSKI